jgi:uncharacterized protein (TIGR02145 family)
MKKIFFIIIISTILISCKKEPKETGNNSSLESSTDSTKYETNGIFSIGKPIGKIGGGVTDIDGNKYRTVIIGTQEWMAENLKVSTYNNGSKIPNIKLLKDWSNSNEGAWCYFKNDTINNLKYGKLYNWYTIGTINKNICPLGWHVPSDKEWSILLDLLGGDSIAGGKMKEVEILHWKSPNTKASNISLFTGLPGGGRDKNADFHDPIQECGGWWSSTDSTLYEGANYSWARSMVFNEQKCFKNSIHKKDGVSIRCVKN